MKKTFKRSLSILLSVLMVLSVLSAGMFTAAADDKEFTMTDVVILKPTEGQERCLSRFIFNATEADLTALNGGPVDLASYGFEAAWGTAGTDGSYGADWSTPGVWGYDANGYLYMDTNFPICGGSTAAEQYAAAAKGEITGMIQEIGQDGTDGIVHDLHARQYVPDLKANTVLNGSDAIVLTAKTEEQHYAPKTSTKTVMLNNCDSAEGFEPYPGDGLELVTDKKTEGTGSIHTVQGGGFCQGGPIAGLDLTGLKSISFDFAANTAEALSGPQDVAFYLFSGDDYAGYQELNNVDTSKVMAFDVDAIRAGYGKDDQSFVTVTTTPTAVGDNFDITNVTGFYFWGCTKYDGSHEQWLDNVVATVEVEETVDEAVEAVIAAIDALPEAAKVRVAHKDAIVAARAAFDALTEEQQANVTNADKLTAAEEAYEALRVNKEILLDDASSQSNWAIGGPGSCFGAPQEGHIWFWWLARTMCTFKAPVNLTGAKQVKIDFSYSMWDDDSNGTGSTFEQAYNMATINGEDLSKGIALTSYTGGLPTGIENSPDVLSLKGEAWTDYAVRVKATEEIVKGMNTFEIDYTTAGAKFDPSAVTGIAIVGNSTDDGIYISTSIQGVWATVDTYADPEPTDPAVIDVINSIKDLPEVADVKLADGDAINAVKAAYDALTEDQKAEVSNVSKLNEVVEAYEALVATADKIGVKFVWAYSTIYGENNKFEVEGGKNLTVKAKIFAEGGTDQRYFGYLQLLGDAGSNPAGARLMIDGYNELATEHNSRYDYDYKTLVSEITVDATDTYKASFVYGGRKSEELANAALTVYEIEVYDGETLITSFCPAEDGVNIDVDPNQVNEKPVNWTYVYGIKHLTPAEEVDELIDTLPEPGNLQLSNIKAVSEAKDAYDALSDEEKANVKGAEKLQNLVTEMNEKFGDDTLLLELATMIDELPNPEDILGVDSEKADLDAIDAFISNLTRAQLSKFRNSYKDQITKYNNVKAEYKKAVDVDSKILCTCEKDTEDVYDFCGNDHATKDGMLWMNITVGSASYPGIEGYNGVYVRVGRYFGEDAYTHFFNYNDYYQFEFLAKPDKDNIWNITHGNEDNNLEWQYPSEVSLKGNVWQRGEILISDIGTSTIQPSTPAYNLSRVNLLHFLQRYEGEFLLKDIAIVTKGYAKQRAAAEQAFQAAVAAIGTVTADSGEAIETAKAAREELNKWINVATEENLTASATLDQAILSYALLDEDNADVKAVYDKIIALPDEITLDNETAVNEAATAYGELTEAKKELLPEAVTTKLAAAVKTIETLKVVKPVIDTIEALEAPENITYANLETVKTAANAANDAFNALTDEQKEDVYNSAKLDAVLAKVAELQNDLDAAKAVETAIDALPAVEDVTAADAAAIMTASAQFNALSDAQKALIAAEKQEKLAALVKAIEQPEIDYGDVDGDSKVTANDALEALQASIGARELSDTAKLAADVDGDGKITANDALCILQFTVGARSELPVPPQA